MVENCGPIILSRYDRGKTHGSPLGAAAYAGHLDIVKLLVQNGADVNAPGGRYGSPLSSALYSGWDDVVEFLLENGANATAQGEGHESPLGMACQSGRWGAVSILVRNGVDVNAASSSDRASGAARFLPLVSLGESLIVIPAVAGSVVRRPLSMFVSAYAKVEI